MFAIGLTALAGTVTWFWKEADQERSVAEKKRGTAVKERAAAEKEARGAADAARRESDLLRDQARQAEKRATDLQYLRQVDLAHRDLRDGNRFRAGKLLVQCDPGPGQRPWEWRYVHRLGQGLLHDLKGNAGIISAVAFRPDGKRFAAGCQDGTVRVYETATAKEVLALKKHSEMVSSVAFSLDGKRLVSAGGDRKVKVYDARSGEEILSLPGHPGDARTVAISADGQRIVTGGGDSGKPSDVKVWDGASGKELLSLTGHTGGVWSVAISADGQRIVSGSDDFSVRVWDGSTGKALFALYGHTTMVHAVAISATACASSAVETRRCGSGTPSRDSNFSGFRAIPTGSCMCPQRGRHAPGQQQRGPNRASLGRSLRTGTPRPQGAHERGPQCGFPSGRPEPRQRRPQRHPQVMGPRRRSGGTVLSRLNSAVFCAAISANGQRVVSGNGDNTVSVWDPARATPLLALHGHTALVTSVAISADALRVVSGGNDGLVKLWDVAGKRAVHTFVGHTAAITSVVLSADGQRVVSAARDNTAKVWDAATGKLLLTFPEHAAAVTSVAISADGQRIARPRATTGRCWSGTPSPANGATLFRGTPTLSTAWPSAPMANGGQRQQ